ncbi:YhcN/YlaJ family sporulation lipoprotein [Sporosarcina luteola]|uniref:YhcN/YlaJ family sporulation lipoprotein n=1 Tax=Sporosarcina luteola TaxID=582850 RepID=UPI002041EA97|nr:YhcN/YlaJ family sporulation lipoprotein [Sporosarcina luteola]MCM3711204.1 YhcN/YlaJ family sporulation lipoprotein [Sporosarcina luteola]
MVTIRQVIMMLCVLLLLTGCIPNDFKFENHTDEDASKAEELLKKDNRIKGVAALFHDDHLLIGIRVKTFSRFNKRGIAREIEKKLKEEYPDLTVFVSADSKILTETNKLILKDDEKGLKKKIHHLISLAEEET